MRVKRSTSWYRLARHGPGLVQVERLALPVDMRDGPGRDLVTADSHGESVPGTALMSRRES
jgi:hypothetical protein